MAWLPCGRFIADLRDPSLALVGRHLRDSVGGRQGQIAAPSTWTIILMPSTAAVLQLFSSSAATRRGGFVIVLA
ncbi:hypothetical protein CGMCC3_g7804 [Colletotrichum fructicola]|nr:uncharacterized protein CGMCC3_g7804 [Colletotrichum fructicola]KAE9576171.1 hypothetical protein CGMCC3_g7804 [Colletotrichum fructicola]